VLARHKRCSLAAHLLGHAGARQQAPIGRELDAAHDVSIVLPRAAQFPLRPLERAHLHERSRRRLRERGQLRTPPPLLQRQRAAGVQAGQCALSSA